MQTPKSQPATSWAAAAMLHTVPQPSSAPQGASPTAGTTTKQTEVDKSPDFLQKQKKLSLVFALWPWRLKSPLRLCQLQETIFSFLKSSCKQNYPSGSTGKLYFFSCFQNKDGMSSGHSQTLHLAISLHEFHEPEGHQTLPTRQSRPVTETNALYCSPANNAQMQRKRVEVRISQGIPATQWSPGPLLPPFRAAVKHESLLHGTKPRRSAQGSPFFLVFNLSQSTGGGRATCRKQIQSLGKSRAVRCYLLTEKLKIETERLMNWIPAALQSNMCMNASIYSSN